MAIVAQIQFVQGGTTYTAGQAAVGNAGAAVTVKNANNGGPVVKWTFTTVDVPPGSAVPVGQQQTGATPTWNFTPDVPDEYLIRLDAQDGAGNVATDFRIFAVSRWSGRRIPSFKSTDAAANFAGQARGWSPEAEAWLNAIDAVDVGTIAVLRTVPQKSQFAHVLHYAAIGDGGGGLFEWDPTNNNADDNCTIIKGPAAIGRWRLRFGDHLKTSQFGIFGTGADITVALLAADAVAASYGVRLHFVKGTGNFVTTGGAHTFSAEWSADDGAIVDAQGTSAVAPIKVGGLRAWPSQQVFTPTSFVQFVNTTAGGNYASVPTMYARWWGVVANAIANDTPAMKTAVACFCLAASANPGLTPELILPPGVVVLTQANGSSYGPILEITAGCVGGRIRGAGTGQTQLRLVSTLVGPCVSPLAVIQRTNCTYVKLEDFDILPSTPLNVTPTGAIAVGATSITIDSTNGANLPQGNVSGNPIPLQLVHYPYYYEEVLVTNVSTVGPTTTLTLNRPTRYAYGTTAGVDYALFALRYCILDFRDFNQAGNSTQNSARNMQLGNSSILNCLYGVGTACVGGTGSTSDANNDEGTWEQVRIQNALIGGVRIGHLNSLAHVFRDCAISGLFYGFHIPQGGGFYVDGNTALFGNWGRVAVGGGMGHTTRIVSSLSEGFGPFIVADEFIPDGSFCQDDGTHNNRAFVQPAVGSNIQIAVGSTANWAQPPNIPPPYFIAIGFGGFYQLVSVDSATLMTIKNLGGTRNALPGDAIPAGTNIGLALNLWHMRATHVDHQANVGSFDVNAPLTAGVTTTVSCVSVGVPLKPGQRAIISDRAGTNVELVQIKSFDTVAKTITLNKPVALNHTTNTGGLYAYISPAYAVDVNGFASDVTIAISDLGAQNFNIPGNRVRMCDVTGAKASRITILETATSLEGFEIENATGRFWGADFVVGNPQNTNQEVLINAEVTILDSGQPTGPDTGNYPQGGMRGFMPMQIRVTHAMSPYFLQFEDVEVIADTTGGAVTINLPFIDPRHSVTVKHDETTGALSAANAVTVNSAGGESLVQPSPNQLATPVLSIVFNAAAQSGFQITWRNIGSALDINGKQPLVTE